MSFVTYIDRKPYIFILPGACGTTSMCELFRVARNPHRHVALDFFRHSLPREWTGSAPVVATYREPIARGMSWLHVLEQHGRLEIPSRVGVEIVRQRLGRNSPYFKQSRPFAMYQPREANLIIDITTPESIQKGLAGLSELTGKEFNTFPHRNKRTSAKKRKPRFTDEALELMLQLYGDEVQTVENLKTFRSLWKEFHAHPVGEMPREWFDSWLGKLPPSCPCHAHALKIIGKIGYEDTEKWRHLFHDLVNAGLKRPVKSQLIDWSQKEHRELIQWVRQSAPRACAGCS